MILFEILLELFGELVLQILFQVILEIVFHIFIEPMKLLEGRFPTAPVAPYLFVGLVSGLVSLLVLPNSLLRETQHRLLNMILTPTAVGLTMSWMGSWRQKKGQELLGLDQFYAGFVLALSFATVRLALAH